MAKKSVQKETVSIRPGVSILSVLSRLNYKPWYALAEFVDNSIQSYLDNKLKIQKIDGKKSKLRIKISLDNRDGGTLKILDNAGGISDQSFSRAFRPAEIPADTSGLHEYGMGMKSASCWFSPNWTVRTSAAGSSQIKTVRFDIKKIVNDKIEELDVEVESASKDLHFTEIILKDLHHPLHGKTIGKVKSHLASIYRKFLRDDEIEIDFDGPLSYEDPKILKAPYFKSLKSTPKVWKTKISIPLTKGRRIEGFAAIRETASTTEAGFALFRKKRLIHGSFDETWRPHEIFGAPNKYPYQRVFGELDLSGFDVSHTKDGFVWDGLEEVVIEKLNKELSRASMDILGQADGHRVRVSNEDITKPVTRALQNLGPSFEKDLGKVMEKQKERAKKYAPPAQRNFRTSSSSKTNKITKSYSVAFRDEDWKIEISFDQIPTSEDLIDLIDQKKLKSSERSLLIRVNTHHPFYQSYIGSDSASIEVMVRYALALSIAETLARDGGVTKAGVVRGIMNEVLRKALAK